MQDNLKEQSHALLEGTSTEDFKRIIIKATKKKTDDNHDINDILRITMKKKAYLKPNEIICTNKYAVLTDKEDDTKMDDYESNSEEEARSKDYESNKNTKARRPPLLVIHGKIENHEVFIKALKDTVKENFHIKNHNEITEVFTSNYKQFSLLKQKWQQSKINFHTYTLKSDKRRTYVIKGLHNYVDINEIKHDLEEMGYKVANINPIKNTKQTKYMVTFLGNMQIKQQSQLAKYICNTKIIWEHYINKRITQCRRCQGWGHATINCYAEPACLKCAEGHLTKDCKKSQ